MRLIEEHQKSNEELYRQTKVLSNGLTVVTEQMPYLHSVAFGVFVKVGSANESKQNNGIAHFIEHMLFKGTKRRSAKQIADETAEMGDTVNAYTTKEFTVYYGTVITESLPSLIDVLADMLFHSVFEESAFQKEKGVIAEEIDMYEDSPDDLVHELLQKEVWKSHALGFFISGEKKTLQKIKRQELVDFWKQYYRPENMVVSVAGKFEKETLFTQLETCFRREQEKKQACEIATYVAKQDIIKKESPYHVRYRQQRVSLTNPVYHTAFCVRKKDIEQVHMNLAFPCIRYASEERYCFAILNSIFGSSNTSLLFQRVREERGLVYSIDSYGSSYEQTGLFHIDVVTNPEQIEQVFDLIVLCIEEMKQKKVTEEVLKTHKQQARAELILGNENARNRMEANGKSQILSGAIVSVENTIKKLEQVTQQEIQDFANRYFDYKQLSVCIVGDTDGIAESLNVKRAMLS